MEEIIDVADDVAAVAGRLADAGVKTVIRYYNHQNVNHPTKCLTLDELDTLTAAGLSVAVVFEQRAGAPNNDADHSHIEDLDRQHGVLDAQRALELARQMAQPEGSAIYFAVDFDFDQADQLDQIAQYFQSVKDTLAGRYRVGVYGSGTVGQRLKDAGLAELVWLAGSRGWSGTRDAVREGRYTIFQDSLDVQFAGFDCDGNVLNPNFTDFGQFGGGQNPPGTGAAARFKVVAEPTLHLRSGPGTSFDIKDSIPNGTIVTVIGREGHWLKVDLDGDGEPDGFMFEDFLQPVSG